LVARKVYTDERRREVRVQDATRKLTDTLGSVPTCDKADNFLFI
jgi:hypothetical protein